MTSKRLYRSNDRVLGGVCAGIAEYLDVDATVVRIIAAVLLVIFVASPVIVYLVLWAVVPGRPETYSSYVDVTPESVRSGNAAGAQGASSRAGGFSPDSRWEYVPPQPPQPSPIDPSQSPAASRRTGTRVLIVCGIVLVCIGIAAIAGRFLDNVDWWDFWPVLVIVWGIYLMANSGTDKGVNVPKVFDGLLIGIIGAVLLVCSVNLVPWSVWSAILALWPLYIIAIGIAVAGGAMKSSKLRVAASLVAVAALALGVCNFQLNTGLLTSKVDVTHLNGVALSSGDEATVPVDLEAGEVEINAGGSSFALAGGEGPQAVLTGSSGAISGSMLRFDPDEGRLSIDAAGIGRAGDYRCTVPTGVVWDAVEVNGGASNVDVDLTQLTVGELDLNAGASSVSVALGHPVDQGSVAVIDEGMSRISIMVPANVEAIVYSEGLNAVYPGNSFVEHRSEEYAAVYETPGYGKAVYRGRPVWAIYVSGGMGTLEMDHPVPTAMF